MGKTTYTKLEGFVKEIDKQKINKISIFQMHKALKKYFGVKDVTIQAYIIDLTAFGFYDIKDPYFIRTKKVWCDRCEKWKKLKHKCFKKGKNVRFKTSNGYVSFPRRRKAKK